MSEVIIYREQRCVQLNDARMRKRKRNFDLIPIDTFYLANIIIRNIIINHLFAKHLRKIEL